MEEKRRALKSSFLAQVIFMGVPFSEKMADEMRKGADLARGPLV